MSLAAMTWAFEQALRPVDKLVLLTIADHADGNGFCYPGQTRVAERASVSERTVRDVIKRLEDAGLLRSITRRRDDGYRATNGYQLALRGHLSEASPAESAGEISPADFGTSPADRADLTGSSRHSHRQPVAGIEPSEEPSVEPSEEPTPQPPATLDGLIEPDSGEPTVDELFAEFWLVWPRKEAKKTAHRAFVNAIPAVKRMLTAGGVPLTRRPTDADAAQAIINHASWWTVHWQQVDPRPLDRIPHASTWLNQERWTDEKPDPSRYARRTTTGPDQRAADIIALAGNLPPRQKAIQP